MHFNNSKSRLLSGVTCVVKVKHHKNKLRLTTIGTYKPKRKCRSEVNVRFISKISSHMTIPQGQATRLLLINSWWHGTLGQLHLSAFYICFFNFATREKRCINQVWVEYHMVLSIEFNLLQRTSLSYWQPCWNGCNGGGCR